MTQKIVNELPEVFLSDTKITDQISRLAKSGKVRKLAPKLYTTNLTDTNASIVYRNLWRIVGLLFSGALVADRTAIEGKQSRDGLVFIISPKKRAVELGWIKIIPRKGVAPLSDDAPFMDGLYFSSLPRALLENMRSSKSIGGATSRTLSQEEMEEKLDSIIRNNGEQGLNKIRVPEPLFLWPQSL